MVCHSLQSALLTPSNDYSESAVGLLASKPKTFGPHSAEEAQLFLDDFHSSRAARKAALSSFIFGTEAGQGAKATKGGPSCFFDISGFHFHAPVDESASSSTYTTNPNETDETSPFSAQQALTPGSGYWCSSGRHRTNQKVVWTGILHKRRPVTGLKISWAYAPGQVRVKSTADGMHWDVVVPWHEPKSREVSFEEQMIFDRPRNVMQFKVEMRHPRAWKFFGINQLTMQL
eukprot:TRINITY_DN52343_c0_g1_i1.p1 TRINITY_DN52343_c0_g1~~TRINITY_DN52343_c0_g1_i1.p1  ORF type:complete len:244 (-),score=42.83 TRINITY_DN52343_c0_g1_i1:97-789(-)